MTASDTLVINQEVLQSLQQNSDYDYKRELMQSDFNLLEWLRNLVYDFISSIFGNQFYYDYRTAIWVTVSLITVALIVFLIYKFRPSVFYQTRELDTYSSSVVDTIYGVDFASGILKARNEGNYREAVRLIYLQTLRTLSDNHLIDWQLFKTPTQYTREFHQQEFELLTNHFLRVRYGNFSADEELVQTMLDLQKEVKI